MRTLRGMFRLLLFIAVTAWHIGHIILAGAVLGRDRERAIGIRRRLAQRLVRLLGIEVELRGEVPRKGILGVTNHRSYADSVAIFQWLDASTVVKAEVSRWPVIGYGLKHTFTVFVDRSDKESRRRTREQIRDFLDHGISVIVFVEGTTYVGPETGEFRPGTFMTAAEGGFEVVPIAIEWERQDMAWVGKDTFVPHFIEMFGKYGTIRAKVHFGPVLRSDDHQELLRESHAWISARLLEMRAEYDAVAVG